MTIDHDDLRWEIQKVVDRIDTIERDQKFANARIRQQIAGVEMLISIVGIVCLAAWQGFEFKPWMIFITPVIWIGVMYWFGGATTRIWEAEGPRWPKASTD